jgi:drug/metabolite transporter (DMT)-like permease
MRKAFLQLHIAVFLAGFTGPLGRLITLNEGLLVWYRLGITTVTLFTWLLLSKQFVKISLSEWLKITGVGAIVALHWVLFYGSIKYANISIALVCFSAIGFFTAFMEPWIEKRKIDFMEVLLGSIAVLGIYLIFHFDPQFKVGIILGILASLLASIFPVLNKRLLKIHSTQIVTSYELAGGFLTLTLLLPFYINRFPADHFMPSVSDWAWLLVLSWLCTVVAFNLSLAALKKISPFTVNLSYNLEPIYGILLAFLIYQENKYLSSGFYIGFGLILLTVILQTYRLSKSRLRKP